MDLESSMNQSADQLTIDRRDLERAFLSIFDQLTGARPKSTPGRIHDTCCTNASKQCCCCRNEVPSFSVLLGNQTTHSCGTGHSSSCRTADNKRKILQIHLPETSKDPCEILITSHREQVTVKYLQQGQQFTFSTNDLDGPLHNSTASVTSDRYLSKRHDGRMFSNRDKNRVFSNSRNDEMFSDASTVNNDNSFDSASKSPMSVTIDRVFSKVQLDRVFSNVENDDGNDKVLSRSETNRMFSNETNRVISNTQTNRRLSNAMNDTIFPITESDRIHSNLEKIQNGKPTELSTDGASTFNRFLQNVDGPDQMSRNVMNISHGNTVSAHNRNEKVAQVTFVSKRNISRPYDQVSISSGSVVAEKPNCKGTSHVSVSVSNRNSSLDLASASVEKLDDDDDNSRDLPPAKKQKKQSLNTFIDSLLTKRTAEEENRKSLDHWDESTINAADQRKSFQVSRQSDLEQDVEATVAGRSEQIVVDPNEPTTTLFSSETLASTRQSLASNTGNPNSVVFQSSEPEKSSTKKARFKCQYCSAMFQQRNDCLIHISKEHMEERPHKCPLCNATFKKTRSLRYHIRHHNGERPYKCTYCEKAFKEKYHLTVHIRTHTNERPFACLQCGKAFKQTNELTAHIRTHSGERPHKCDICNKSFKRKRQLYNHNLIHLHGIAVDTTKNHNDVVVSIDTTIKHGSVTTQQDKHVPAQPTEQ